MMKDAYSRPKLIAYREDEWGDREALWGHPNDIDEDELIDEIEAWLEDR